jgi:hypothetical protein
LTLSYPCFSAARTKALVGVSGRYGLGLTQMRLMTSSCAPESLSRKATAMSVSS